MQRDFGSVRILDFSSGACEIRTFLTTSRFADSRGVAIGLHATGFVSVYISLAKYFSSILFCNHNYLSILVYLLFATDTQSKLLLL